VLSSILSARLAGDPGALLKAWVPSGPTISAHIEGSGEPSTTSLTGKGRRIASSLVGC
jgi:hypothetical protein